MQKLTSLIGKSRRGPMARDYNLAYAYHSSTKNDRKSFVVTIPESTLVLAKAADDDRADIFVDPESRTAAITLSPKGDYCLSGCHNAKAIKLSSVKAIEVLANLFPIVEQVTPLEVIGVSTKSIAFKLP